MNTPDHEPKRDVLQASRAIGVDLISARNRREVCQLSLQMCQTQENNRDMTSRLSFHELPTAPLHYHNPDPVPQGPCRSYKGF